MAELKRNRLKTRYLTEIVPALMKERGYKNIMEVPKLEKIVLNMRLGDIKDNSKSIQTAIAELEAILANCEVIQDNDKNKDVVKMESVVVLHDVEFDEDIEYTIVGSSEADSLNNKISNESPLGAALIGKKKGDTVKVEAPVGEIEYTVVSVKND